MKKILTAFYKKTSFWENIKRTLALFSGGAVFTLHELDVDNTLMIIAGVISFIVATISIWFTDQNNDGIIDLFDDDIDLGGKVWKDKENQ